MNITVFGATGRVGTRVVDEALARGHRVTAVARNNTAFSTIPSAASATVGDASRPDDVARLSRDQDVIISATSLGAGDSNELAAVAHTLLAGIGRSGVRLIVVGGAGPLVVPDSGGTLVADDPHFVPVSILGVALACVEQLDVLRRDVSVDWTYLSPSAEMTPGQRTAKFRIGTDELIIDRNGASRISIEDLAVALIDEAETPQHRRAIFTVGY